MGHHVQDGADLMSALTKRPEPSTNTVFELRTQVGTCIRQMKIIEATDQGYGSEVRIIIEKVWEPDNSTRGIITLTHTEQLDALIEALTKLRGTYV